MVYAADADPFCYPGTTVLINLLDLREQDSLDEAELALTRTRFDEPLPAGDLDVAHSLKVHHHIFQDVYAWAGQTRTIRIGKGGNWFCYPEFINAELRHAFNDLGNVDNLAEMPLAKLSRHLAHFLSELNAVHAS